MKTYCERMSDFQILLDRINQSINKSESGPRRGGLGGGGQKPGAHSHKGPINDK